MSSISTPKAPASLGEALEILDAEPTLSQVEHALAILHAADPPLCIPGPAATRVYRVLIERTLPDYWEDSLRKGADFVALFRTVPGIGAIVTSIRQLTNDSRKEPVSHISYLLELLELVLQASSVSHQVARDLKARLPSDDVRRKLIWTEYVQLVASGTLTSSVAQAEDSLKKEKDFRPGSWLANGPLVAEWQGSNVAVVVKEMQAVMSEGDDWDAPTKLLSKSLSFGYREIMIGALLRDLAKEHVQSLSALMARLKNHDQRKAVESVIQVISTSYLAAQATVGDVSSLDTTSPALGGCIALLQGVVGKHERLEEHVANVLTTSAASASLATPATRRAIIRALSTNGELLESALEKCWNQFSNHLFIQHASLAEQQAMAQTVLVLAGYIHRSNPMALFMLSKSSKHISGTSNRLASSNTTTRFLGMFVAMAISALVDKADVKLVFEGKEMQTDEAKWYLALTRVSDEPGNITDVSFGAGLRDAAALTLRPNKSTTQGQSAKSSEKAGGSIKQRLKAPPLAPIETIKASSSALLDAPSSTPSSLLITPIPSSPPPTITTLKTSPNPPSRFRITELDSNTDPLTPYEKPDSDPEDDSTDPTLVTRHRPRPPVYIRQLLKDLSNTEDIARRSLALLTAPDLIRRKAAFGTEVSDHVDELATVLAGLSNADDFDLGAADDDDDDESDKRFAELRERALRAVLVASPQRMGPWFGNAVVRGMYSVQQKLGILVAVGLGGRELAGFASADAEERAKDAFPSKRLEGKMADIWACDETGAGNGTAALAAGVGARPKATRLRGTAVDGIAVRLSRTMLEPMALSAADEMTGPDVLKVRRFSSRLDVEKSRKRPAANKLSAMIADSFFYPLLGGVGGGVQIFGGSRGHSSPSSNTHILPTYLRTLTILLHAAGPSSPSLPNLTAEYWPILLSLRSLALIHPPVLEALLFSLLTLLELNSEKQERLVNEHGKAMLETQEWARMVLEGVESGGGQEGERTKMLAAGIVVRCGEVVDKYRRLLLGDMIGY